MDLIFYFTLAFFVLIFSTTNISIDYDFWARLIVGKSFFQTGTLFNNDFYSYGATHQFIDHEWGSSLVFYLVQNYFNDAGIYVLKATLILLTLFVITKIIKLDKADVKLHFLFFFFVIHSICYNIFSTVRCQSFSFLFFVIYLFILKYAKKHNNYKILWTLPVLNIVWANMHGGFTIGLILILLFGVGEFLNKEKHKPYFIAFFVSCLTTLINPYGIRYVYFIVEALSLNRIHIIEWQSAFFGKTPNVAMLKFKIFFFITLAFFAYSIIKNIRTGNFYQKIDKTKYLILLFVALISLKSLRFHVFFSYCVLALCYVDFYNIFNKQLPEILDNIKEAIMLFLMSVVCISCLADYKFINILNKKEYPIYCVDFIQKNNLKGNVFTNFHEGSYVAYKLYPNNLVFMDGRYEEVYDNNLVNEMGAFFLDMDYKKFIEKYHTDIFIIDKYYPIANKLKEDNNYFSPYEDESYILFLSKKFKNKKFIMPEKDLNYYYKNKFKTNIDWF